MKSTTVVLLGCLLIAIGVAGCASPQPYVTPTKLRVSDQAEFEKISTEPLSVEDAVRLGILSSNKVLSSDIISQQSKNEAVIAKAAFYPEFYFNLSAGGEENVYGVGSTGLRYTLYDFGERAAELAAARIGIERAKYELLVELEDSVVDVMTSYIELAINTEQLAVSEEYLKSIDGLQDGVKARVDIGVSSRVDLNDIETGRLNASGEIIEATVEKDNSAQELSSLVDLSVDTVEGIEALENILTISSSAGAMPEDISEFARIAALSKDLEEANQKLKATRAGLLPRLGLRLGIGLELNDEAKLINTGTQLGPEISNVISLGGGRGETVQNAELDVLIALRAKEEEIREITLNNQQAASRLDAAKLQIKKRQEVLSLAHKTRDVMDSEYQLGTRSLRDLINAEERIHQAKTKLNLAYKAHLKAQLTMLLYANRLSDNLFRAPK